MRKKLNKEQLTIMIEAVREIAALKADIIKRPELKSIPHDGIKILKILSPDKILLRISFNEIQKMTYLVYFHIEDTKILIEKSTIRTHDPALIPSKRNTLGKNFGGERTSPSIPGAAINH